MLQSYMTVERYAHDEFIERHSRFIGYCQPASTENEAIDFINKIRAKHWDATHNVYAYNLREGQVSRYSDDGEPSGTAGIPVLDVLKKSGLTDLVVVVTRYFGGVLLGAGGLVRAYSHSASIAVEAAHVVKRSICLICRIVCAYSQYGKIAALIPECGGIIDNSGFMDNVTIDFHIPPFDIDKLNKRLADFTSGEVQADVNGQKYFTV